MRANGNLPQALQHAWLSVTQDHAVFMAWTDLAIFTAVVPGAVEVSAS